MPKQPKRSGPEAAFWADPAADPVKLCKYLSLWPYANNRLCQAARDRIMADNGLAAEDIFPVNCSETPNSCPRDDITTDAPLFAGKENA